MMMVPSGTTALTPGVWLSACASAAGIVAATALRSESLVTCVSPTWLICATRGAWIDAAVASRAFRWAPFDGRLVSWLLSTTTTASRLPDARALTSRGLNLEKPILRALARGVEPAAEPTPVTAVTPSAATPSNEATFRGVTDILLPPFQSPPLRSLARPYSTGAATVNALHNPVTGRAEGRVTHTRAV